MKAFVDWILARRYRLILMAAALAPLLQIATAALVALDTLRRGVARATLAAVIGTGITVAFAVLGAGLADGALEAGANVAVVGVVAAVTFGIGIGLGALVLWARGLTLAFQGVVLLSAVAVLVASLFGPGGEGLLAPLFERIVEMMREADATDEQIEAFRRAQPLILGLLAAGLLTQLLIALFLAYWWRGLAVGDTRFGAEFRDLRLSRVLGLPASVLVTVGLVLESPVVQNLAPLALFGFLFQGLAVMHAWAHARRWPPGLVAVVYSLLVILPVLSAIVPGLVAVAAPLVGAGVLALAAVGLIDNWFDLRAPLRAGT